MPENKQSIYNCRTITKYLHFFSVFACGVKTLACVLIEMPIWLHFPLDNVWIGPHMPNNVPKLLWKMLLAPILKMFVLDIRHAILVEVTQVVDGAIMEQVCRV